MLSGWQFIIGGLVMAASGFLMGGRLQIVSSRALPMLMYLAFISAAAYSLWGILLKYNPVSRVAVFGFMNPVFGVFLSALLLGEKEQAGGLVSIVSLILVSAGIWIVNRVKEPGRAN
jgi:drug/metabolite transporter (DMT)-like permease